MPAPSAAPILGADRSGEENFPVALAALPRQFRQHLLAVYAYARLVDQLGDAGTDSSGARLAALDNLEGELDVLFRGGQPHHPVLAQLAPTVRARKLPDEPFRRLLEANRQDQQVRRYTTFDQLVGYCRLSANPVGELVLGVFGCATPDRIAWSDQICTALQLIEHLQDTAEDWRAGRRYLPSEDMRRFGVDESVLAEPRAGPRLRGLIGFEAERAGQLLESGSTLVRILDGWARLAVTGYVAGGRAALLALARSGYDPLPGAPQPRRRDVLVQGILVAGSRWW